MRMLNSQEGKDQAGTMTVVMRDYLGLYLRLKCFTSIAQNLTRLHLLRNIIHRLLRYPNWKNQCRLLVNRGVPVMAGPLQATDSSDSASFRSSRIPVGPWGTFWNASRNRRKGKRWPMLSRLPG